MFLRVGMFLHIAPSPYNVALLVIKMNKSWSYKGFMFEIVKPKIYQIFYSH